MRRKHKTIHPAKIQLFFLLKQDRRYAIQLNDCCKMDDYLKIINDNIAQMWFETDIIDMKNEVTNTFNSGYLEDSNAVGLPKTEGSQSHLESAAFHFQESPVGAERMAENFNYSSSFLSQIPPLPAVNCSSTDNVYGSSFVYGSSMDVQLPCLYEPDTSSSDIWDVHLPSYFDLSGSNQDEFELEDTSYFDYQDEGAQLEQQQQQQEEGYGQEWYNTVCSQVPTVSEPPQRELGPYNGSGQQDQWYHDNEVGNNVTRVKYFGGPRNQASLSQQKKNKKRFFQVVQATPSTVKGGSQYKPLPMITPNTRIIKPMKGWKAGNTGRYMTTVMSLCGHTKDIYHPLNEVQPADVHVTQGLSSTKRFAPTSALMVTTDAPASKEDDATPPAPPQRNAILPASLPHVGRSPVVFKNTVFGHKKLKHRCNACAFREATLGSLITHVKAHGFPYCVLCALVFATAKQLAAHVRKAHTTIELPDMVTVTSKYGRKRHVLSSVAFAQNRLYPKRKTKSDKKELPAKKRLI